MPEETEYTAGPGGAGSQITGSGRPQGGAVREVYDFLSGMVNVGPPWLRRRVGGAIMRALGSTLDTQLDRTIEGLALRFPNGTQTDALALTGAERGILRGPGEDSVTYAARLRTWWSSHRTRGGGFALAAQLYPYFVTALDVSIDIIGETGVNHNVDAEGNVVRSVVSGWTASTEWAQFTVVINLDDAFFPVPDLSESGEPLGTFTPVALDSLTPVEESIVCAVISEWSAAHISKANAVLLAPGAELWDYAGPGLIGEDVGVWDTGDGATWDGSGDVVKLEC